MRSLLLYIVSGSQTFPSLMYAFSLRIYIYILGATKSVRKFCCWLLFKYRIIRSIKRPDCCGMVRSGCNVVMLFYSHTYGNAALFASHILHVIFYCIFVCTFIYIQLNKQHQNGPKLMEMRSHMDKYSNISAALNLFFFFFFFFPLSL